MRRLALIVLPLVCQACGRDAAAPVWVATPDIAVRQVPTGGYDIDVYDIMSGSLTQATSLAGNDEYKPSLSKNGGSIVQI